MAEERSRTREEPPAVDEEPLEADEADAADQRLALHDDDRGETGAEEEPVRDDVNPADAAEQHRSVPLDEDDYR
jgi:hypothetical protein